MVSRTQATTRQPSTVLWRESEAVFEAKFMLPCSFSEEAAVEKYMAQLQHNIGHDALVKEAGQSPS
jgi:hypothetical protein